MRGDDCPSCRLLCPLLPRVLRTGVSALCAGGKPAPGAGQQAEPRGQRNSEGQAGDPAEGQAGGEHAGSKLEGKGSAFSLRAPGGRPPLPS